MDSKAVFQSLLGYHVVAMRKIWAVVEASVTSSEFQQDVGFSWGSIRNELLHVATVDRGWIHGLQGKRRPPKEDLDKYPDLASVKAYSTESLAIFESYFRGLTDEELEQTPKDIPGTRWQILLHLVNHGTDHRARVICMLKRLGKQSFDQDYAYYLMGRL